MATETDAGDSGPGGARGRGARRGGEAAGGAGRALGGDRPARRPAAGRRRGADAAARDAAGRRRGDGDRARADHVAEQLERAAGGVLAPDIQDTLNISDTTLIGISAFGGVALVLGAIPLAWLADRMSRVRIVWIATLGWAVATALNGLVVNPFQLFCTPRRHRVRPGVLGAGVRVAAHRHVPDPGPGPRRTRCTGWRSRSGCCSARSSRARSPTAPAATEGWRWTYLVPRDPAAAARRSSRWSCCGNRRAAATSRSWCSARSARTVGRRGPSCRCRCRPRTQRMKKIKTFYFICTGIGVLGFALVAVPVQLGLLLEDSYGYGAFTRGWMLSLTAIASLVAIPIAGLVYDRLFRADPELRRARSPGAFIIGYGAVHARRDAHAGAGVAAHRRRARQRVHERRVRERRPDRRRGRAVPHAHAGVRAHPGVHLPHGRVLRRPHRRRALRRARRAHRAHDRRADRRARSAGSCSCTARAS